MVTMGRKKLADEETCYGGAGADSVGGVDDHGRATELRPLALSSPHTQAFHLAWLSLFACFFAAFAAPPILSALRPSLVLAPSDAPAAAVGSLSATLVGRLAMGPACDLLGPRRASGFASLVVARRVRPAALRVGPLPRQLRRQPALDVGHLRALRRRARERRRRRVGQRRQRRGAGRYAACIQARPPPRRPGHRRLARHLPHPPLRPARRHGARRPRLPLRPPAGRRRRRRGQDQEELLEGGAGRRRRLPRVGARAHLRLLLRRRAHHGECGGRLLPEAVPPPHGGGGRRGGVLRRHERGGAPRGRGGVGRRGEAVRDAREAVGALGRPDRRRCAVRASRQDGRRGGTVAGRTVAVMVACAAFVQAASGLTFGIVPFVSKRSLGVVSGMTASGGAVGAIVTNRLFFSGSRYTVEEAISLTGAASLVCTLPLALVHFPRHGGMLRGPTATGGDDGGSDDDRDANDHGGDYYTLLK